MYKAIIVNKEVQPNGATKVWVQFTNGEVTLPPEEITPQNQQGLDRVIKARLSELSFTAPDTGEYVADKPKELTQEEKDRNAWIIKTGRFIRLKTHVDNGLMTSEQADLENLKADIANTFNPDYKNYV